MHAMHRNQLVCACYCCLQEISEAYGVLSPDGIALRGLFIIDKEGVVQVSAAWCHAQAFAS